MSKPIIADNKPVAVQVEAGQEYHFCVCGRSTNQPFCDGSHAATDLTPQSFVPQESGKAVLCQCKHTANAPYCDGTHKQFEAGQVGQEGS